MLYRARSDSLPEDRGERCLDVTHVGGHGRRRSRLRVVRGFEFRLLLLAFDGHSACDGLLGILLVVGEWCNGLVIADLGRL